MWICKKCNEEIEDSFDACWKCQNFLEKKVENSDEHQIEVGKENKKKVIILNETLKIYQDNGLTKLLDTSLPLDSEITIGEVEENNAVEVFLPDSTKAFIDGNEMLNIIQLAWTVRETIVYEAPDQESESKILKKGEELEILNEIDNTRKIGNLSTGEKWVRIRLRRSQISFMKHNTEMVTEESVYDFIAELIGEEESKESIVKKLTEQGVSQKKAIYFFDEINEEINTYKASPQGKLDSKKASQRKILWGIFWVIGGSVATLISMESGGSSYTIFYGAILYGGYDIIKGILG
jgi:hypothetical protein